MKRTTTLKEWYDFNKDIINMKHMDLQVSLDIIGAKSGRACATAYHVVTDFETSVPFIVERFSDYIIFDMTFINNFATITVVDPRAMNKVRTTKKEATNVEE